MLGGTGGGMRIVWYRREVECERNEGEVVQERGEVRNDCATMHGRKVAVWG